MSARRGARSRLAIPAAAVLAAAAVVVLAAGAPADGQAPTAGPDGRIVYRCGPAFIDLCAVTPATRRVKRLTDNPYGRCDGTALWCKYRSPSLSADGRTLAFTFRGGLHVANRRAKKRRRVPAADGGVPYYVALRGDAKRVAFTRYEFINRGPAHPDYVSRITDDKPRQIFTNQWMRWTGTRLVVATRTGRRSPHGVVCLLDRRMEKCARTISAGRRRNLDFPAVSPDGRLLAAVESRNPRVTRRATSARHLGDRLGSVVVYSMRTGERLRRITGFRSHASEPVWSPDGGYLAFNRNSDLAVERSRSSIWLARADGQGKPTRLAKLARDPTWGPSPAAERRDACPSPSAEAPHARPSC